MPVYNGEISDGTIEELLPVYSVDSVDGVAYGFALNANEYYESQNKGVDNSSALCRINFNTQGKHLCLDCINYAENNYDFGILSNINSTLTLTNNQDTTGVFHNFKGASSETMQTVDYGAIEAGENFIYVKFIKNSSANEGNDSLQFKVRIE